MHTTYCLTKAEFDYVYKSCKNIEKAWNRSLELSDVAST